MKELDTVRLKKDYENFKAGTEGVIVLKHNETLFEVEFTNKNGETITTLAIPANFLEPLVK